jgi:hypothetical protein
VDPRIGLDDVEKRKCFTLLGLELQSSMIQLVASRYTNYAIPTSLVNFIWNMKELPDQGESITIPIYRKDNTTDCSNYGISLLSTSHKILYNILLSR